MTLRLQTTVTFSSLTKHFTDVTREWHSLVSGVLHAAVILLWYKGGSPDFLHMLLFYVTQFPNCLEVKSEVSSLCGRGTTNELSDSQMLSSF